MGEKKDGIDTIEWIIKQPWCSGKICTCGISYLGATQLVLQLSGDIKGLETSVITCPSVNSINGGWIYAGEFLDSGVLVGLLELLAMNKWKDYQKKKKNKLLKIRKWFLIISSRI